jgi:hypothetical protein
MFQVNTTTGTLVSGSFDVTLPGLDTFDNVASSSSGSGLWFIFAFSASGDELQLAFNTAPTPGSLVGFTGGSIVGVGDTQFNYAINGGSITPVPEPSSLVLFATGMLVLSLTWRFGKKVGHSPSA